MPTRCKVRCTEVTKRDSRGWYMEKPTPFLYNAKFTAVGSDGSPENKEFFASTPTLTLDVGTVRPDHFEPGKEYYLDFTAAEPIASPQA